MDPLRFENPILHGDAPTFHHQIISNFSNIKEEN
jgi:hypothetical protein